MTMAFVGVRMLTTPDHHPERRPSSNPALRDT